MDVVIAVVVVVGGGCRRRHRILRKDDDLVCHGRWFKHTLSLYRLTRRIGAAFYKLMMLLFLSLARLSL